MNRAWNLETDFNHAESSRNIEAGVCLCLRGNEKQAGSGMEKAKSGGVQPAHNLSTIPAASVLRDQRPEKLQIKKGGREIA